MKIVELFALLGAVLLAGGSVACVLYALRRSGRASYRDGEAAYLSAWARIGLCFGLAALVFALVYIGARL